MTQLHDRIVRPLVRGRIGLWRIIEPGRRGGQRRIEPISKIKPNQIQYSWGFVAAQAIGRGDRSYRVRTLYIEYENVASPGDPVTVPTFGRDEGLEYYSDLQFSAARDYLRVPLLVDPDVGIEPGFEDFFTEGVDGNKLTFYTQTQGTAGVHGKPFTNAANSKVCGAALVATPDFQDVTQDVIFARTYFDSADHEVKQVSSQFGITWEVSFL